MYIIANKTEAQKEHEAYVAKVFGADTRKSEDREAVEVISARTREVVESQRKD